MVKFETLARNLFATTVWKRRAFFLLFDLIIIALSLYASFWLRFEGQIPQQYIDKYLFYLVTAILVKIAFLYLFGMYNFSWRFFGVLDLARLITAAFLSSSVLATIFLLSRMNAYIGGMPRSVLLIDFIIAFSLMMALRVSKRIFREYLSKKNKLEKGKSRILIIGAGEAGHSIVSEMMRNPRSPYLPVGFVDDDKAKHGLKIHGVKVLGGREDLPDILKNNHIDEILIAIPSVDSREIRKLVTLLKERGWNKRIRVLPGILDLVDGKVELKDIKDIRIEDLLSREPVSTDFVKISGFINGRCILVTGAGGSIGSEVVTTILRFSPGKVIALDIDETELFNLMNRLPKTDVEVMPVVADIRDRNKMEQVFRKCRPEVIIHSAAYKHVPIIENFPEEAIKTNVMGTKNLAELAIKYGTEKFINISTDKAINPASIMGASKRVSEEMLKVFNKMNSTRFISVRFGNVLGSRGSVIPLFEEQIEKGGPVTVTHPEMKRYFMATSEAVILVLQAAASGEGGEVFILDMGEPIKIVDLAREMIRLKGLEPDIDIQIEFTGLRPGEKLFEELLGAEEGSEPTEHPKIFKARPVKREIGFNGKNDHWLMERIGLLIDMSSNSSTKEDIIKIIKEILPTYQSR
ncbi:MAG: polysaccharide biosynthesis protein [Candidatus Aminicenantes bacterium]|nr:polysaccharide biosynthesis protein [Candidatus Aminicenantes bacterium]